MPHSWVKGLTGLLLRDMLVLKYISSEVLPIKYAAVKTTFFRSREKWRFVWKIVRSCVVAAILLFAAYLWYSRPLSPDSITGGNLIQAVGVSCDTISFTPSTPPAHGTLFTRDADQIRLITDLLEDYPVNRTIGWNGMDGGVHSYPANRNPITCVRISIHYKPNEFWQTIDYDLSSEGSLSLICADGTTLPCLVGRFGEDRTGSFYQTMRQFYRQNRESPFWKDS